MATTKGAIKQYKNVDLLNITTKLNDNVELTNRFVDDVIRVTGLEIDDEGYIVDPENDPLEPDYIVVRGKVLRLTNQGIIHTKDLVFDPYNNPIIMEELFRRYLAENHPEVTAAQIYPNSPNDTSKVNPYGYITILYNNGAKIKTGLHYKDATKYLDAFMRMESMTDILINDILAPYDEFEAEWFSRPENKEEQRRG